METATLEILKIKPRKPHYDTVSRRPHRVIVFSSVTVTVVWAKQFETARSLVRLLFEYFTSAVNKHRSDLHAWWRIEQESRS